MIQSKYAATFARLRETAPDTYNLRGNVALVEILPRPEIKTAGGLILGTAKATHRATAEDSRRDLGLVILVGDGYDDGSPADVKVGDVVILPSVLSSLSEFPGLQDFAANTLAFIRAEDIVFSYNSIEAFETAVKTLNNL